MPDQDIPPHVDPVTQHLQNHPIPDPTVMTTNQLRREVANLRELIEAKVRTVDDVNILGEAAVRRELELMEDRRKELKKDTEDSVARALVSSTALVNSRADAMEKAIEKSEAGTANARHQQNETVAVSIKSLTATMDDMKERVNKMEAIRSGARETIEAQRANAALAVAVIVMLIGILSVAATIMIATR